MQKMRFVIFSCLTTLFVGLVFTSFLPANDSTKDSVITILSDKIDTFANRCITFEKALMKDISSPEVNDAYFAMQAGFREIQFLLEHISEETVKRYFNGPPLLSVEQNIPAVNVLQPRGLQVIDELLFDENPDSLLVLEKTRELHSAIRKTKNIFLQYELSEADIKMAIYKDIVRIFTLQVTGFDTPGSAEGLRNAVYNLAGISHVITKVFPDHAVLKEIKSGCDRAAGYLQKNKDFGPFDRVTFYKKYIRPIMENLARWSPNEQPVHFRYPDQKNALTFRSGDIFSEAFFQKEYFGNLPLTLLKNKDVAALGKSLFYDPILSADGVMSCASCHKPEQAFTDGLEKSITNTKGLTGFRNTPTLINAIYTKGYFYDLREEDPNRQIVHVVRDKTEFNTDFIEIMEKLAKEPTYKSRFETLFPNEKISKYTITAAITTYVASLTDFNSPFDKFMRGELQTIDSSVIRGFNLFAGKAACATCHFIPTFNGLVPPSYKESESEVLGIPFQWRPTEKMELDPDPGRIASGKPRDGAEHLRFSFKTTTIRNIEKTGPYMHNGTFGSLEEVMDFYNRGGGNGIGFNLAHQTLSADPLELKKNEIQDIIQFMKALTGEPDSY